MRYDNGTRTNWEVIGALTVTAICVIGIVTYVVWRLNIHDVGWLQPPVKNPPMMYTPPQVTPKPPNFNPMPKRNLMEMEAERQREKIREFGEVPQSQDMGHYAD